MLLYPKTDFNVKFFEVYITSLLQDWFIANIKEGSGSIKSSLYYLSNGSMKTSLVKHSLEIRGLYPKKYSSKTLKNLL